LPSVKYKESKKLKRAEISLIEELHMVYDSNSYFSPIELLFYDFLFYYDILIKFCKSVGYNNNSSFQQKLE
jgi:hypothetical protein